MYRIEQVAALCDVSVDTVRFYRGRGLLPPPARRGRVATYDDGHLERIRLIRSLQRQGLTLAAIRRVVEAAPDAGRGAELGLAAAVAAARSGSEEEELLSLEELALRCGVAAPLLLAFERAGAPLGHLVDGRVRYSTADVTMVELALRLINSGLPLPELLALAHHHNQHVRGVAETAVRLFDDHIRAPIRASAAGEAEAAERLVTAFRELLPAITALVAVHFRGVLLAVAEEHLERVGDGAALAAARSEGRRAPAGWPA